MSTRRSGDAYAPEPTVRSWRVLSVQVYLLSLRRPLEVPVHLLISAFGCRCTFAHSSTLDRPAMRSVFANPPLGRRNTGSVRSPCITAYTPSSRRRVVTSLFTKAGG